MPYGKKSPASMGHKDSAMEMSPYKMGHKSAMEMGHESPAKNQNKGYAKQERKDLLQDNPVAKDAEKIKFLCGVLSRGSQSFCSRKLQCLPCLAASTNYISQLFSLHCTAE